MKVPINLILILIKLQQHKSTPAQQIPRLKKNKKSANADMGIKADAQITNLFGNRFEIDPNCDFMND